MKWIAIVVVLLVVIFVLIILSRSAPQDYDEEAIEEAKNATPEELDHILHPPPKSAEEIEEENEMYAMK